MPAEHLLAEVLFQESTLGVLNVVMKVANTAIFWWNDGCVWGLSLNCTRMQEMAGFAVDLVGRRT